MFDFVQEKKRWVQIVLALVTLPFAFWGIDSYKKSGGEELAAVNGEKITPQEFDNALNQQKNRMREILGAKYDAAMFDKPEAKVAVLDNLINQRLLTAKARAAGLMVDEAHLAQVIGSIPAFQKDGKFDKKVYASTLAAQNMSSIGFEKRVGEELAMREWTDSFTQNGYAAKSAAENIIRINEQARMVSIAPVVLEPFLLQAKVGAAEIQAYYDKNSKEFQVAEQARVEYLTFSADALQSQVEVSEEEIKQYYNEHQPEFGTPEQRHAAHILIAAAATASDADKKIAKAKAEKILAEIKQAPAKFAELAKANSQDPGSAANGGDLGLFGRGMMVKPFEDTTFQLKVGEISGLVQSDFGFHIIKLIEVKAAQIQPLAEVKSGITQKLKVQKASNKFAELAEKFSNTVYEQSDSLKAAAEGVKLPVQQSVWLSKGQANAMPFTDKAMQSVFTKEVMQDKRNSTAVEIAPNTLFAARMLEHKPASTRPLAEVSVGIQQKLIHQQAVELAEKQSKNTLAQLQKGELVSGVTWQPAVSITRGQHAALDPDLVKQVFLLNGSKLPAYAGGGNAQTGYTLVRLDAVKDTPAVSDAKRSQYVQEMSRMTGEEMLQAYLADAKKHAKISMKPFSSSDDKK
jgi:peptidyl-prolyl cis-trans isomerase D